MQRWQVPIALYHECSYQFSFIMAWYTFKGKRWQWFLSSNVKCTFISPVSKQWSRYNFVIKKRLQVHAFEWHKLHNTKLHLGICRRMIAVTWDTTIIRLFIPTFWSNCAAQWWILLLKKKSNNDSTLVEQTSNKHSTKMLMWKYNTHFVLCNPDC